MIIEKARARATAHATKRIARGKTTQTLLEPIRMRGHEIEVHITEGFYRALHSHDAQPRRDLRYCASLRHELLWPR